MSKKKKPEATEPKPESDLAAFEKLPEKTKELMRLKEQEEKLIGAARVAVTRKIKNKGRKPRP